MESDDAPELERLFRAPLADFVATRKALAAELKQRGDKDAATRLARIAKPSVPAWLANQLFHERPDAWREALDAGRQAREAQERGGLAPARMQTILLGQRRAIERLVQLAEGVARERGQSIQRAHLRTLEDTLAALVADPSRAPHGRLTEALAAPSFDALDLAQVLQARPPAAPDPSEAPATATKRASPKRADDGRVAQARQRVEAARRRVDELRALQARAGERVASAREQLQRARSELAIAEQRLSRARAELETRNLEASAAEDEAERQAEALREALDEATRAERALGELE